MPTDAPRTRPAASSPPTRTARALQRTADLLEAARPRGHRDWPRRSPRPASAIAREDPDASIVVVHDDADHALDLIDELQRGARRDR